MNQNFSRYVVVESHSTIGAFILYQFQPNLRTQFYKKSSKTPFLVKGNFPKKSGSVSYNPTWPPNTMLSFKKKLMGTMNNLTWPLLDQFMEKSTEGWILINPWDPSSHGWDPIGGHTRGWLIRFLNFGYIYTSNFLYSQPCPQSKQYTTVS